MKIIILILFLTPILSEHNNPNGKPFTLNLSINYNGDFFKLNSNMPINEYVTINGGVYVEDEHGHSWRTVDIWNQDGDLINEHFNNEFSVFYLGAELHMPLYKIWKK